MSTIIRTICIICGEYVDNKQIKKAKAVCEDCDISVYGNANIKTIIKTIEPERLSDDKIRELKKIERDLKESCKRKSPRLRSRGLPRDKGIKWEKNQSRYNHEGYRNEKKLRPSRKDSVCASSCGL